MNGSPAEFPCPQYPSWGKLLGSASDYAKSTLADSDAVEMALTVDMSKHYAIVKPLFSLVLGKA